MDHHCIIDDISDIIDIAKSAFSTKLIPIPNKPLTNPIEHDVANILSIFMDFQCRTAH